MAVRSVSFAERHGCRCILSQGSSLVMAEKSGVILPRIPGSVTGTIISFNPVDTICTGKVSAMPSGSKQYLHCLIQPFVEFRSILFHENQAVFIHTYSQYTGFRLNGILLFIKHPQVPQHSKSPDCGGTAQRDLPTGVKYSNLKSASSESATRLSLEYPIEGCFVFLLHSGGAAAELRQPCFRHCYLC